jgi:hypothetical protein
MDAMTCSCPVCPKDSPDDLDNRQGCFLALVSRLGSTTQPLREGIISRRIYREVFATVAVLLVSSIAMLCA